MDLVEVSYRILQGFASASVLLAAGRISSALFGYITVFSISQQDKYCNMSEGRFFEIFCIACEMGMLSRR
jgi:hypothetical protein